MTDLSPAAQAIVDAYNKTPLSLDLSATYRAALAAAPWSACRSWRTMADLSPAAQAVWDAFDQDAQEIEAVAAALRAAAEIVAPLSYEDVWTDGRMLQYEKNDPVREKLLAIAAELEGAQ